MGIEFKSLFQRAVINYRSFLSRFKDLSHPAQSFQRPKAETSMSDNIRSR